MSMSSVVKMHGFTMEFQPEFIYVFTPGYENITESTQIDPSTNGAWKAHPPVMLPVTTSIQEYSPQLYRASGAAYSTYVNLKYSKTACEVYGNITPVRSMTGYANVCVVFIASA